MESFETIQFIWIALFIGLIIGSLWMVKAFDKKPPLQQQNTDGETILDPDDESFGMYTGALPDWLEQHPSNSSVDHFYKKDKQQILDMGSSPAVTGGSTMWGEFSVNRHIRT